ncbi:MAG: ABC transporter ATP-binding protein [Candidatus Heimdallarchaeota archaeon]|nr:ABC transporter ATP-binding protein [Candidatus Heimdallarchaeota archaeon]
MSIETEIQEPVIQFTNVSKRYRDVQALRDVSFTIKRGDIFGYIGPNGAGKTTTLKILVGLIRDYSGEVKIVDESLQSLNNPSSLIGYMPQDVGFQDWRTVNHALTTFGLLSGMKKSDLHVGISEVLDLVGLTDVRNRKIKHLSGGMEQKLKLAQALLHKPQILILDEPLSGLDPTSRWQMKNTIKKLAESDITILFSSHILSDVEDIATTIGILKDGIVVKIGSPQELEQELIEGDAIDVIGENITKVIDLIKELPFTAKVESFENNPNRLIILFNPDNELNESIVKLLQFFGENRLVVKHFNYRKPSLEEVYLKYIMGGSV